jgi:hypothetical protein
MNFFAACYGHESSRAKRPKRASSPCHFQTGLPPRRPIGSCPPGFGMPESRPPRPSETCGPRCRPAAEPCCPYVYVSLVQLNSADVKSPRSGSWLALLVERHEGSSPLNVVASADRQLNLRRKAYSFPGHDAGELG